jgi:hypothetical protein
MAFDANFKTMAPAFWWSLEVVHGLGWFFLAVASLIAPRSWQDRPAGSPVARWWDPRRLWGRGDPAERLEFRRRLLDHNAFFWLAARAWHRPTLVWGVLGFLALVWNGFLLRVGRDWLNSVVYLVTALALNLLTKLWVAAEASRQLAEERQEGTLELLLSTPLAVEDILRGQGLALARQFLAPVLVILGILLAFLLGTLRDPDVVTEDERRFAIAFYSAGMLMLVVDLIALYWLGMWRGLSAKSPQRAFLGGVVRLLLLPWIGMALAGLVIPVLAATVRYEPGTYTFLKLWVLLGLAADLGFASWARFKLRSEFRSAATGKYSTAHSSLKR